MRHATLLPAIALALVAPIPALASSCAEQIGTIERRLDSAGAVRVSGLMEGHSLRTGSLHGVAAVAAVDHSDPDTVPTADHVTAARALIARASAEDSRGDKRACENTMSEAKGMIGALP